MTNILTIGIISEGVTDERFLPNIIRKTFEELAFECNGEIEVYEPESFKLNTFEVNEFANFVVSKLHNYDALAKRIMGERDILISKLEYLRKGGDMKKVFAIDTKSEVPKFEVKRESTKIETNLEKKKKSKKNK